MVGYIEQLIELSMRYNTYTIFNASNYFSRFLEMAFDITDVIYHIRVHFSVYFSPFP